MWRDVDPRDLDRDRPTLSRGSRAGTPELSERGSTTEPREALTRDHLIPLSRGGTNDWTNVVAACSPCNTRKGNRLPEEIGMHPLTHPVEPHFVHLRWAVRRLTPTQAHYIRTFYGSEVLHHLEQLEHRGMVHHGGHSHRR